MNWPILEGCDIDVADIVVRPVNAQFPAYTDPLILMIMELLWTDTKSEYFKILNDFEANNYNARLSLSTGRTVIKWINCHFNFEFITCWIDFLWVFYFNRRLFIPFEEILKKGLVEFRSRLKILPIMQTKLKIGSKWMNTRLSFECLLAIKWQ